MKKAISIWLAILTAAMMAVLPLTVNAAQSDSEMVGSFTKNIKLTEGKSDFLKGDYTYGNIDYDGSEAWSSNTNVLSCYLSGPGAQVYACKEGFAKVTIKLYSRYGDESAIDTTIYNVTVTKKGTVKVVKVATPKITKIETVSFSINKDAVKISWAKVSGAQKYRLYYKGYNRSTGKYSWVKMADVTGTSYVDTLVNYGNTYTYTIRCITSDALAFTSGFNGTGWKHDFVAKPKISGIAKTSNGFKISWNAPKKAVKYRVYYKNNGWKKLGDTTKTYFYHNNLTNYKVYTYTVRAITSDGKSFTSYYDSSGKGKVYPENLATPSITKMETVENGIKLNWKAVSHAQKYRVYGKVESGSNWKKIGDTSSTSFLVKDNKLWGTGKRYIFTVRCINSAGNEFMSGYNSTGWKHAYVSSVGIWSAESVSNGIQLRWFTHNCADKYRIYRKSGGSGWKKLADTTSLRFLDTDVRRGTTYTYTIRAISSDGKSFQSYYDTVGKSCTYR